MVKVPELKAKLGCYINQSLRVFITYDGFYINHVIRSGNQIDRQINLSQNPLMDGTGVLSGKKSPFIRFNNNGMWSQGASLGWNYFYNCSEKMMNIQEFPLRAREL